MTTRLSPIARAAPQVLLTATLTVETKGVGFVDITRDVLGFMRECRASNGLLTVFLRHTSASLTIQENADPDVQTDLVDALNRLAPEHAGYVHDTEGPDDMPAHVRTVLTQTSIGVPIIGGSMSLGTWQGLYLWEHRTSPHRRIVSVTVIGE